SILANAVRPECHGKELIWSCPWFDRTKIAVKPKRHGNGGNTASKRHKSEEEAPGLTAFSSGLKKGQTPTKIQRWCQNLSPWSIILRFSCSIEGKPHDHWQSSGDRSQIRQRDREQRRQNNPLDLDRRRRQHVAHPSDNRPRAISGLPR